MIRIACAVFLTASLGFAAPENLAPRARATADSEYSANYTAARVIDGVIPGPMSHADVGKSWCVRGDTHRNGATLTLTWPQPVEVAEVVYYGRTAWEWVENWKGYEVRLDHAERPIATGTLKPGHGPQRIRIADGPIKARVLALRFTSSYGGSNPGAAEIEVYASSLPDALLGRLSPPPAGAIPAPPAPPMADTPQLADELKSGRRGFTKLLVVQRHYINCSHVYTYHCEGQKDGGGLFILDLANGSLRKLIDSPDGQIESLDLSFDGTQALFAWRKEGRYHLYAIGIDGTNLRQLTRGDHDNFDGVWLPDGGIAFISTRAPNFAYCWTSTAGVLHRMDADGGNVVRLSANYLNDFTPCVMSDGRIVYGRWEYVDRPAIPIQSLWSINPDGTGVAAYFGNRVLDPASFVEPRCVPGTNKVVATMCGHNEGLRGAIGLIDPIHGNNAPEGIHNATPEVPLRDVNINTNGPHGPFQTAFPLDEELYLVSYDGTILCRDYARTRQATLLRPQGLGFHNPQPIRSRPVPPVRASVRAEGAGPWASVYVQDIYNGLEPHVRRGQVKRLAVVQEMNKSRVGVNTGFGFQRPVVSCGATYIPKKVWGFASVNEDGSAYFKVPTNVPIYFMALDEQGRALQRMRSFTHLMPGETQGCVGCHEPRHTSPRSALPVGAVRSGPADLTPPEWGVSGFSYAAIVQPVLGRHCVGCHNHREAPKNVDLSGDITAWFNISYDVLAHEGCDFGRGGSKYVSWISTMNGAEANILEIDPLTWGTPKSRLADLVLSGHPDADGKPRINMPAADRQRLFTWIDVNVPYYGTSLTNRPELPGGRELRVPELPKVLADVALRRCAECHANGKLPAGNRLRISPPENNAFLMAPLARDAGGTGKCGQAVFASKQDSDYQLILRAFEPTLKLLKERPRVDMGTGSDECPDDGPTPKPG